ncbi:MAG: hypothetical protein ACFB4I_15350 [Cyanophyceae cyanobacterium]
MTDLESVVASLTIAGGEPEANSWVAPTDDGVAGNDTLTGDDFSGRTGADTFVLSLGEGTDTITDFGNGDDLIEVLGTTDFSAVQDGSDALIVSGEETLAGLSGVNAADVMFA